MVNLRPNGGLIYISMHEELKKVMGLSCVNCCNRHGVLNMQTTCIPACELQMGVEQKEKKRKVQEKNVEG